MQAYYHYTVLMYGRTKKSGVARLNTLKEHDAILLIEQLYDNNCVVLTVRQIPAWLINIFGGKIRLFKSNLNSKELTSLLRDLSVMIMSGIPIMEAFVSLMEDDDENVSKSTKRVVKSIFNDLKSGLTISEAFDRQPHVFPETVRSLVHIGQTVGNLDKMLKEASLHIARIQDMKSNTKQALIYPAFVFTTLFGVAFFWIYYVIPNMAGLFKQMKFKLPALTIFVMNVADFVTKNISLIAGIFLSFVVAIIVAWKKNLSFRRFIHWLLHKLPISRTIITSSGLAFFCEYLSILTKAGVDTVHSLEILNKSINDTYYKDRVEKMREMVSAGHRISAAMREVNGFPGIVLRLIIIGENTGTLEEQLAYLAEEYKNRLDSLIGMLSEILKPIIILVAGGFFIFLILALLLPVYEMIGQAMSIKR